MYAVGKIIDGEIDWLKSENGEIVIFESKSQAKDQLRLLGIKRKGVLIVPVDSEDLATFFANFMLENYETYYGGK